MKKERDALKGRASGLSATMVQINAAKAAKAVAEQSLEQSKQRTNELVGRFREMAEKMKQVEAERGASKVEILERNRAFDQCAENNLQLFEINSDLLNRYEHVGLFTRASASEPFTKITRTRIDNLVDEYRGRAEELRVKKRAAAEEPAPRQMKDIQTMAILRRSKFWSRAQLLLALLGAAAYGAATDDAVVASVGSWTIRDQELNARLSNALDQASHEYDARANALKRSFDEEIQAYREKQLGSMIDEYVLAHEAKARKTTSEALLAALNVTQITEAETRAFYDENANNSGQPYDAVAPRIREYLQKQAADVEKRSYLNRCARNTTP